RPLEYIFVNNSSPAVKPNFPKPPLLVLISRQWTKKWSVYHVVATVGSNEAKSFSFSRPHIKDNLVPRYVQVGRFFSESVTVKDTNVIRGRASGIFDPQSELKMGRVVAYPSDLRRYISSLGVDRAFFSSLYADFGN